MEYDDKMIHKFLRRKFRTTGWMLVVYYVIMNVAVIAAIMVEAAATFLQSAAAGDFAPDMDALVSSMMSNGWGYLAAGAIGLVIMLCWKGKDYWKHEVWAKGKPMTPGAFFGILTVFLACQVLTSFYSMAVEAILNAFGFSAMAAMESATIQADTLSMFLYAAIAAPITEELLFRGYIQRMLLPYGKKFAIFSSAFLFGIFHGNLIQTPFAFLVGLVLGYVAAEYSVVWAMVLHMVNNLVLADMMSRITSGMPQMAADMILGGILWAFAIAAVVVLIVNRKKVGEYLGRERMDPRCVKCFFLNGGVITLTVMMLINMVLMITAI